MFIGSRILTPRPVKNLAAKGKAPFEPLSIILCLLLSSFFSWTIISTTDWGSSCSKNKPKFLYFVLSSCLSINTSSCLIAFLLSCKISWYNKIEDIGLKFQLSAATAFNVSPKPCENWSKPDSCAVSFIFNPKPSWAIY